MAEPEALVAVAGEAEKVPVPAPAPALSPEPVAVAAPAQPIPVKPAASHLDAAYAKAMSGYRLVPLIAGALVALCLGALAGKFIIAGRAFGAPDALLLLPLVPAALLILASWVRFEEPDGRQLNSAEAPELFALIEKVRSFLKAPAIDAVYVTGTFDAKAVQRPSRGLMGGWRNEIVIGLPLLQSVSKAEAAVLIAHELGHISGRNGEKAAVVHRARLMWQHILERQERQPLVLRLVFAPLVKAFAPGFLAASAPAEREAEFAADAYAAEIAGNPAVASVLQRLAIAEAFLAEYWKRVAEEPVTTAEPNLKPHREMANFLPRMTEWEEAADVLEAELAKPGAPAKPSLAERLEALKAQPDLPQPVTASAESLLGRSLGRELEALDAAWRKAAAPAWKAAWDKLSPDTKRLMELDALAGAHALDLAPAIERAKLAYFAAGMDEARTRYEELLIWHRADGRAHLAAGMAMLDAGSPDAVERLREAVALAPRTDWGKIYAEDWFGAGEALLEAGEDFGIDCLEQSIRIDPSRTDVASFMVDRYLDQSAMAASAA